MLMAEGSNGGEHADVDERYAVATNASSLKVVAHSQGAVDVLAAAAWSPTRLGGALLRLHSEWSASEKPVKPTKESVKAMVGTFQKPLPGWPTLVDKYGQPRRLTGAEAGQYASAWYAHEMAMLLQKLKTLPAVREQVVLQAMKWRMGESHDPITRSERTEAREQDEAHLKALREAAERAPDDVTKAHATTRLRRAELLASLERGREWKEDFDRASEKAAAVLRYWLDQTCQTCHGRKFRLIPGTPSLSNKACAACGGSGVGHVPHQQEGRKLANYMDACVYRARQGIGNALHGRGSRGG